MKIFIAAMTLTLALFAHADDMKVRASDYNCEDLQQLLVQQGSLYIMDGPSNWGLTYKSEAYMCEPKWEARAAYIGTKDEFLCRMGWACARRP